MISDREHPMTDVFGWEYGDDPRCEFCDRSLVTRFGGMASAECPSCEADFRRSVAAAGGRVELAADESEQAA